MAAVLPKEYVVSLSRLLDKAHTYDWPVIEKVLLEEFGPRYHELLRDGC